MARPTKSVSLVELAHLVELFRTHRPRLEAIFARKIQHTPMAGSLEVIFQEAYLLAVPRWPAYLHEKEPPDGFVWLYGIVRDSWIAELRRHYRNGRHLQNVAISADTSFQIGANLAASISTPSQHLIREELIAIVRDALNQLPEEDRLIIEMHDDDGLTFREIAEQLGQTTTAVNKRYTRARDKKLKPLLEKMLGGDRA